MKYKIFLIIIFSFLTISCGFKVIDRSELLNFSINTVTTEGEKRINYKLKNKLTFNTKKQKEKSIKIHLNTSKQKIVKEKNIKNEITKYEIKINVKVFYDELNGANNKEFSVSRSGDFNVTSQYSQTLNNEKILIDVLTDKIADEIIDELSLLLNAV